MLGHTTAHHWRGNPFMHMSWTALQAHLLILWKIGSITVHTQWIDWVKNQLSQWYKLPKHWPIRWPTCLVASSSYMAFPPSSCHSTSQWLWSSQCPLWLQWPSLTKFLLVPECHSASTVFQPPACPPPSTFEASDPYDWMLPFSPRVCLSSFPPPFPFLLNFCFTMITLKENLKVVTHLVAQLVRLTDLEPMMGRVTCLTFGTLTFIERASKGPSFGLESVA